MAKYFPQGGITILLSAVIALTLGLATPAFASDGEIHVGNHILKEKYRHKRESYYIPLVETVEQFGMTAEIRDEKIVIRNTVHGDIRIPPDQSKFEVAGKTFDISNPPIMRDRMLFFPSSFFTDVLDLAIHGEGNEDGLYISRKIEVSDVTPDGVMIAYPYPLSYTDFELDDGDSIRLVVDFDGALLDGGLHQAGSCDSFENFRAAQFTREPDITRIVLEMKKIDGNKPKYSIDKKPKGLWIGLRPNTFQVELKVVGDSCIAEITRARYDELKVDPIDRGGEHKLVLDFISARFPEGIKTVPGIGPVSRVRLADHEGNVRIVFDLLDGTDFSVDELPGDKVQVRFAGKWGDLSGRVFVIDPGHGGGDPGACVGTVQEKVLNLEMALWLADELRSYGATVHLTRTSDIPLTLEERIAFARRKGPDLFVCIHTNATLQPVTEVHGPLLIFDDDCDYMDLLELVYDEMVKHGGREGLGPRPDDRGLYILTHRGEIPVLFIEAAFMTNPGDLLLLTQPEGEFKRDLMHGVATGILRFFTGSFTPSPFGLETEYAYDHSVFNLVEEEGLLED